MKTICIMHLIYICIFLYTSIVYAVPNPNLTETSNLNGDVKLEEKDPKSHGKTVQHGLIAPPILDKVQTYVTGLVKNEEHLQTLVDYAIDYAHNIAMLCRTKEHKGSSDVAEFASFSLFPSPFPKQQFDEVVNVQKYMQLLYFRVGRDVDFLEKAFEDVVKADKYIAELMDIVREVHQNGIKQPLTVLFQRSDYMLNVINDDSTDEPKYEIKQVEVNTSAIGCTTLARGASMINRKMLLKATGLNVSTKLVPDNAADRLVEGLYVAWKHFNNPSALILFIRATQSTYIFDQRLMEYKLEQLSGNQIKVVELSINECAEKLELAEDFSLRYNGQIIGVAYNRMSILANLNPQAIAGRGIIERSNAIKAPSLAVGMSGSKKIQQVLAKPGVLEHFFPQKEDAVIIEAIRKTFGGLWGLGDEDVETAKIIKDAIANPDKYVMKPNRECGGNNLFGDEITEKLSTLPRSELAAYILMEKFKPMVVQNYMIRPFQKPLLANVVSELGIYGTLLGDLSNGRVIRNTQVGLLMRSKWEHVNEGGVSVGSAVHDSPYLF